MLDGTYLKDDVAHLAGLHMDWSGWYCCILKCLVLDIPYDPSEGANGWLLIGVPLLVEWSM
jgi:hypothetical protein